MSEFLDLWELFNNSGAAFFDNAICEFLDYEGIGFIQPQLGVMGVRDMADLCALARMCSQINYAIMFRAACGVSLHSQCWRQIRAALWAMGDSQYVTV